MVWVAGRDGVATAWDLGGERSMLRSRRAGGITDHGSVDLTGQRGVALQLIEGNAPHRAYLVDPGTGDLTAELTLDEECICQPMATAIAADGSVAVGVYTYFGPNGPLEDRGTLAVWSTTDGSLEKAIPLPLAPAGVALDPRGTLATVNGQSGFALVDVPGGTVTRVVELTPVVPDGLVPLPVATSRDGLHAAVLRDKTVHVISLPDGDEVVRKDVSLGSGEVSDSLSSAVWSADGSVLVVGSLGGQLQFLDGQSLEAAAPPRLAVGGFILTLAISPDGRLMVNTGTDGEARLWDTTTWSPLGQPVLEAGGWTWAAFTDNGTQLSVISEGTTRDMEEIDADPDGTAGQIYSLPTDADAWVEAACSIAGRDLTQAEWDVIRPGQTWRPTCGDG
jgi:WD40 repeat protein